MFSTLFFLIFLLCLFIVICRKHSAGWKQNIVAGYFFVNRLWPLLIWMMSRKMSCQVMMMRRTDVSHLFQWQGSSRLRRRMSGLCANIFLGIIIMHILYDEKFFLACLVLGSISIYTIFCLYNFLKCYSGNAFPELDFFSIIFFWIL